MYGEVKIFKNTVCVNVNDTPTHIG